MRVLPQYHLRPFTVFAIYPSRRYLGAKVRTLLEHLRATLSPSLANAVEIVERYADKGAADERPTGKGAARIKDGRGTRRAKRR